MSARRTRVSPRLRIRENDAHKDVLPPPADTGFVVGTASPFNESRAIDFVTGTVVYPTMLYSGSSLSDVGGILAEGRQTPGASDVHFNITTGTLEPFKEIVPAQTSSRLLFEDAQGSFAAPLGSRHAITIDITPSETKYVYRCPQNEIDQDTEGEFTKEGTGFCYFNFVTKRWDDIGITDPITGGKSQGTDFSCESIDVDNLFAYPPIRMNRATGSDRYMGQFVPPNHANQRLYEDALASPAKIKRFTDQMQIGVGTANIGQPTVSFFAPFATKYHATQSNVLKMSNYISAPFLLEKVLIEVPVVARRTHVIGTTGSATSLFEQGRDLHLRDMDNYVFFLYRQVRFGSSLATRILHNDLRRDQLQDATSSDRFLIASASACFYNSPTITSSHVAFYQSLLGSTPLTSASNFVSSSFPFHTPAFKYDFDNRNIDPPSNPTTYTSLFSGTLRLEMTPAISSRGAKGSTPFPYRTPSRNFTLNSAGVPRQLGNGLNYIQHVWPGTPGSLPYGTDYIAAEDTDFYTYFSGKYPLDPVGALTYAFSGSSSIKRADTWYSWAGIDLFHTFNRDPANIPFTYGASAAVIRNEMQFTASLLNAPQAFLVTGKNSTGLADIRNYDQRFFFGTVGPGDNLEIHAVDTTQINTTPYFGASSVSDSSARETPIILLPEDNLILGIDAGITPYEFITPSITGSFLKIESKRATITLYGSQIVQQERRSNLSRDQFSSYAISQDISGGPVVDEYLTDPLSSTYGNYHAPVATASLGSNTFFAGTFNRQFQWQTARFAGDGAGFVSASFMVSQVGDRDPFTFESKYTDWFKYPRITTFRDASSIAVDKSVSASLTVRSRRFVFRNDRFGQAANFLYVSPDIAARSKGVDETYPVTVEITGSTAYTQNTSLHSTASFPYFDS